MIKSVNSYFETTVDDWLAQFKELEVSFGRPPKLSDVDWRILQLAIANSNDLKNLEMLKNIEKKRLFDEGKFDHAYKSNVDSSKYRLQAMKKSSVVEKVQISAGHDSCTSCKKLDGKTISLENALKSMPIPVKNCTNEYFGCRCIYVSGDEY